MRARNIKPGFFKNAELAEIPVAGRLLFIGLWCLADREGRLIDRPKQIKAEVLPYDNLEIDNLLGQLKAGKFILRYEVDGSNYIQIENFLKHQQPHYKESPSLIPPPDGHKDSLYIGGGVSESLRKEIIANAKMCKECESDKDLTIDHILPRSLGGTNEKDNLQCLCRKCNSAKNNRIMAEARAKLAPTLAASSLLIPDVLIPDVLIPDVLIPDTGLLNPENKVRTQAPKSGAFKIPSVQEVDDYAKSQGLALDAQYFCDHYESNGWRVGRNPMKSWQATIRKWVRGGNNGTNDSTGTHRISPPKERIGSLGKTPEELRIILDRAKSEELPARQRNHAVAATGQVDEPAMEHGSHKPNGK